MKPSSPGDLCRGRALIALRTSSVVNGLEIHFNWVSEIVGNLIWARKLHIWSTVGCENFSEVSFDQSVYLSVSGSLFKEILVLCLYFPLDYRVI